MSRKRVVYVVVSASGQYEDYRTTPLKAFRSKEKAEGFAQKALNWARRWEEKHGDIEDYDEKESKWGKGSPHDADLDMYDAGDVSYHIDELPFIEQ